MQRMWRQMFAAAAGVLVVAGIAAAQSPPPNPFPPARPAAPTFAPPTAPAVLPASGGYNTPVTVRGNGGCVGCGSAPAYYANPNVASGCGSCKSDAGFMFGSCKSFFDPCGPVPCGHGGRSGTHRFGKGGLGGDCPRHPYATPYGTGYNGCCYDSYLNH